MYKVSTPKETFTTNDAFAVLAFIFQGEDTKGQISADTDEEMFNLLFLIERRVNNVRTIDLLDPVEDLGEELEAFLQSLDYGYDDLCNGDIQ